MQNQREINWQDAAEERDSGSTLNLGMTDRSFLEKEGLHSSSINKKSSTPCLLRTTIIYREWTYAWPILADVPVFSGFNFTSRYFRIEIDVQDNDETQFSSHHGQYGFFGCGLN